MKRPKKNNFLKKRAATVVAARFYIFVFTLRGKNLPD